MIISSTTGEGNGYGNGQSQRLAKGKQLLDISKGVVCCLDCPVQEYCVLLCEHFMAINSTSQDNRGRTHCQPLLIRSCSWWFRWSILFHILLFRASFLETRMTSQGVFHFGGFCFCLSTLLFKPNHEHLWFVLCRRKKIIERTMTTVYIVYCILYSFPLNLN